MNIKKLLLLLCCIITTFSKAQSYTFSTLSGSYSNLTGSTSLNGTVPWDDPEFIVPIGFNFQYFGSTLTDIVFLGDGDGADFSTQTQSTGILPILIAYGADIIDRGYDFNNNTTTGSLSPISYLLQGVVGSRILKIEWKNAGFYSDLQDNNISTDFINFQLWLYEGSNTIEIHFGPKSITQPDLAFDLETGARVGLVDSYNFDNEQITGTARMLDGVPTSPNFITTNDNDLTSVYLNGIIPNGTIYRFINSSLSVIDFETNKTVKLFPNPAKDNFTLSTVSNSIDIKSLTITNTNGAVVNKLYNPKSSVDISYLKSGMYFIKIETELGQVSKKLIKL